MLGRIVPSGSSARRGLIGCGLVLLVTILAVGVMGRNGRLPHTDALSGKKTGWFGKELPRNAGSSWNPFAAPLPTPTPQLAKMFY
ncbi:MAG TPA: hypothetical protein PLR83_08460 [Pyrinomonadaceae bacterium]|nr:hypothetical protein [Pyrinomonadaceae bacterium]